MPRALFLFISAFLFCSFQAAAADLKIKAFAGDWKGNAVSESTVSESFRLTSRDIDVELRENANGFKLTWKTVQRQKGDPNKPDEVLKAQEMTFDTVRPGVWRAKGSSDPLESDRAFVWAHIEGSTLIVNSFKIYPDGGHEMQTYRRTMRDLGMALEYVRMVGGEVVRRAKGRLIKYSK